MIDPQSSTPFGPGLSMVECVLDKDLPNWKSHFKNRDECLLTYHDETRVVRIEDTRSATKGVWIVPLEQVRCMRFHQA